MQLCHPRAGARAAGRPIEPPRVDRHRVAAVACVRAWRLEIDVVTLADLGVERVHRHIGRVDGVHHREGDIEHALLLVALEGDPEPLDGHDGVEVATESEVVGHLTDARHLDRAVEPDDVGGHVANRDRLRTTILNVHPRLHEARRDIEANRRDGLGHLDHAGLDQDCRDTDRAVPAHRKAAAHLDVDDTPVRVRTSRRLQDRTAHRGVTARLVHQQGAQVVGLLHDVTTALGHRRPGQHSDTADDHPGWHPLRVGVDGVEDPAGAHQPSPSASAFSVSARIEASISGASGDRGGRHGPP